MKVCIPTETNEGKAAQVFGHFGSAPYFTICDTEKNTIEIIDNANQHHAHGSCQPLNALNGKKVDVIVTGGMGGRAVMMLNNAGVKAYQAIIGTVEDVLAQHASGSLKEITPENACSQHNCGGH
jgi:predicted Fe-Mo cluster-binding NifX family protein